MEIAYILSIYSKLDKRLTCVQRDAKGVRIPLKIYDVHPQILIWMETFSCDVSGISEDKNLTLGTFTDRYN